MKMISIFAGSADRERALRFAGKTSEGEEGSKHQSREPMSQDEDEEEEVIPMINIDSIN